MAALKSIYYLGGYSIGGYFLMKLIVRDPETLRKELPERHELDYETTSQKRNAAFASVLKKVAEGESPEAAAKKVREQWEKELVQKKTS